MGARYKHIGFGQCLYLSMAISKMAVFPEEVGAETIMLCQVFIILGKHCFWRGLNSLKSKKPWSQGKSFKIEFINFYRGKSADFESKQTEMYCQIILAVNMNMNTRSSAMLGSQSSTLLHKNFRIPAYHLMNSNKENINYLRNNKEVQPEPHRQGGHHMRRPIFEQKKIDSINPKAQKKGQQYRPVSAEVRIVSPKNVHFYARNQQKLSKEENKSVRPRKKSVRFSDNQLQIPQELNTIKHYKQRQFQQKEPKRNRSNSILKNKSSSLQAFDFKCSNQQPKQISSSSAFSISQYKNTLVRQRFNQLFKSLTSKERRYISQRCSSSQQVTNSNSINYYIDPNFPTTAASVFKNPPSQSKSLKWRRLSQVFKDRQPVILPEKQSNVIIYKEDKNLANIHFISVLNLIRSSRTLLGKFLQSSVYNQSGIYLVKIFVEHEWKCIIIDDFIPVIQDQNTNQILPMFSSIRKLPETKPDNQIQLWPLLLEKAYAVALGSYQTVHQVDNLLDCCHSMGLPVHKLSLSCKEGDWKQEIKINNQQSIIYGYSKNGKEKEEKLPYRLKYFMQRTDKKEDTNESLHFQEIQTKMTLKMSLNFFRKTFQELMIIKISNLQHITSSNVTISSRYRSRTNQRLTNQGEVSKSQNKTEIRKEKPLIKSFVLTAHQQISILVRKKKEGKDWLRVFLFMKEFDSLRWIEGRYDCQHISFSSQLQPGHYYIVILPDWTIDIQRQLFLVIYSKVNSIALQNHTDSNPEAMIEKGCCDYVQRFGKMIQVNRWICTYAVVHRQAGIVIENINNERRNGKVKIFRSIANLNPSRCSLLPLNDQFYNKGELKPEVELSLQKDQSYSVVLLLFGGIDQSFLSTFNFGV